MSEPNRSSWLIYMIRADDGCYYTGITTDLARRWRQHSTGKNGARFFRGRRPEAVVYIEPGHDRSSALKREAAIKKLLRSEKQLLLATAQNALNSPGASLLTWLSSGAEQGSEQQA